jgi:hypothetical protein
VDNPEPYTDCVANAVGVHYANSYTDADSYRNSYGVGFGDGDWL